jgi:hypothetical protein
MTTPPIPEAFRDVVAGHQCGILAHFDLADAKRRNNYLGFAEVDRDIDELTSVLANYGTPIEISARIAGAQWAVFLSGLDPRPLVAVLERFERAQTATVGWTAVGRKRFRRPKKQNSIRKSILQRGLRCVYSTLSAPEELASKWQIIHDRIPYACVGQPSDIQSDGLFISDFQAEPRWRCIDDDVAPLSCPYCGATDFEWYDADSTVFGRCGICRSCKADVEFQNYFALGSGEMPCNNAVNRSG